MIWIGKIIGAFLGLLVAGPAGLMIGLLIGHLFDSGVFGHWMRKTGYSRFNAGARHNDLFFEAIFRLMGYLAKSDGQVTPAEIAVARRVMRQMSLNPEQQQQAINRFNEGKADSFDPQSSLDTLRFNYARQPAVIRMAFDILQQIARADGPLSQTKEHSLNQIAQALGIMPFHFDFNQFKDFGGFGNQGGSHQRQRYQQHHQHSTRQTNQPNPYTVLGLTPTASDAEIKKRYRRLMSQYHPDKLVSQNLPKEEMAKATEKTQQIKAAYDQLRRKRGL